MKGNFFVGLAIGITLLIRGYLQSIVYFGWVIYRALLWPYGFLGAFSVAVMTATYVGENNTLANVGLLLMAGALLEAIDRRRHQTQRKRSLVPLPPV